MMSCRYTGLLLLIIFCVTNAAHGHTRLLLNRRSLQAAEATTAADASQQRDLPWLRNQVRNQGDDDNDNRGNNWGSPNQGLGRGFGAPGGSSNGNNGNNRGGWSAGRNSNPVAAPVQEVPQPWLQQPQQQGTGGPGNSGQGLWGRGAQGGWGNAGRDLGNTRGNRNDGNQQQPGGNRGGWSTWLGGRGQQPAPAVVNQPSITAPDTSNDNPNGNNFGGPAGRNNRWNQGRNPGWTNWGQQGNPQVGTAAPVEEQPNRGFGALPGRNQGRQGNNIIAPAVEQPNRGVGALPGRNDRQNNGNNPWGRWGGPGQTATGPRDDGLNGFGQRGPGGWGAGRNRPSLAPLTSGTEQFGRISQRPIRASGEATALAQGLGRRGNARSAANALATAFSTGRGEAAAEAVASAAASGGDAFAIGEAVAETTYQYPRAAPWLLRQSADLAVNSGNTRGFSRAMSSAFVTAKKNRYMPQFTTAVADAIATGGAPTRFAYGQAIATAIAEGGEGQAAVAEATATAFCEGGGTATAWAQAYAVALSQNSQGCLVLSQARALAVARCGNGVAETFSRAQSTSLVLGFCGLFDFGLGSGMGWSGSTADTSSSGNGLAEAGGWGNTGGGWGNWGKK